MRKTRIRKEGQQERFGKGFDLEMVSVDCGQERRVFGRQRPFSRLDDDDGGVHAVRAVRLTAVVPKHNADCTDAARKNRKMRLERTVQPIGLKRFFIFLFFFVIG